MLEATLLENVDRATKLNVEEAFGPLAILIKFRDWNEALDDVNDSKFGLQAGIFTRDIYKVLDAWDRSRSAASWSTTCRLPRRQHALWRGQGFAASAAKASASRWRT